MFALITHLRLKNKYIHQSSIFINPTLSERLSLSLFRFSLTFKERGREGERGEGEQYERERIKCHFHYDALNGERRKEEPRVNRTFRVCSRTSIFVRASMLRIRLIALFLMNWRSLVIPISLITLSLSLYVCLSYAN